MINKFKLCLKIINENGFIYFFSKLMRKIFSLIIFGLFKLKVIFLNYFTQPKNKNPIVSFIIPVFDRTEVLRSAIESCLSQTVNNFEVILVSNGSPKKTISILKKYENHPKVKVFYYPKPFGNAVRGRNKAIKEAHGKYIAFLDSDDVSVPDRIKLSLNYLEKNKYDVVYGSWQAIIDGSRKDLNGLIHNQVVHSPDCTLQDLLTISVPVQSTVMVRKELFEKIGLLKTHMEYREDHELWTRLAFYGARFKSIPAVLCKLRLHSGNNELKYLEKSNWYLEQLQKEYKKKGPNPLKIGFVVAGLGVSGGLHIIFKYANYLHSLGHDVYIINTGEMIDVDWFDLDVPIYSYENPNKYIFENNDIIFATFWITTTEAIKLQAKRKIYFVQSDERRFYDDYETKLKVESTYKLDSFEFMTEAKWIQKMLKNEFKQRSNYVPNGLDPLLFFRDKPKFPKGNKLRVLIEGPIDIPFKGMQDSYNAIKDLDCEILILSSAGKPKKGWKYFKFINKVPINQMRNIYSSADIFLKMSKVEGFFGPPMEAMACGCAVVVSKVTGYDEYIKHNFNALVVESGDVSGATEAVKKLLNNKQLRSRLVGNSSKTIQNWTWDNSYRHLDKLIKNSPK